METNKIKNLIKKEYDNMKTNKDLTMPTAESTPKNRPKVFKKVAIAACAFLAIIATTAVAYAWVHRDQQEAFMEEIQHREDIVMVSIEDWIANELGLLIDEVVVTKRMSTGWAMGDPTLVWHVNITDPYDNLLIIDENILFSATFDLEGNFLRDNKQLAPIISTIEFNGAYITINDHSPSAEYHLILSGVLDLIRDGDWISAEEAALAAANAIYEEFGLDLNGATFSAFYRSFGNTRIDWDISVHLDEQNPLAVVIGDIPVPDFGITIDGVTSEITFLMQFQADGPPIIIISPEPPPPNSQG